MTSQVTQYGTDAWLSVLFGVTSPPSGYYVGLANADPGTDTDGDLIATLEPGDTYARQAIAAGATNWGVDSGHLTNLVDIAFPVPTALWGQLDHYSLCTASTSGEVYAYGELYEPAYVDVGDVLIVPAGGIVVALATLDSPIAL